MLKVLPVQSKDEQKNLCALCNVEFKEDLLAYAATVDDEFCGICQFKLTDKGGIIYDIAHATGKFDRQAIFVLGRAALNFIDLCGVHNAFFLGALSENIDEALIRLFGFKKNNNGKYEVDLTNFFDHPCQH